LGGAFLVLAVPSGTKTPEKAAGQRKLSALPWVDLAKKFCRRGARPCCLAPDRGCSRGSVAGLFRLSFRRLVKMLIKGEIGFWLFIKIRQNNVITEYVRGIRQ